MKKLWLGLLLTTTPLLLQTQQLPPINLGVELLSFIDGTNYISIGEIFNFAQNNINLINGAKIEIALKLAEIYELNLPAPIQEHADETGRVGLIWFQDGYHTLRDLKAYEAANPNDPELSDALTHCCNHFEKFSEDYVAEIETAKAIMIKIISRWADLRNRPDSLLLRWSQVTGTERDALYKTMTSFETFDTFLEDLLLFLKDLVQNCPKSHKKYREQHNKK